MSCLDKYVTMAAPAASEDLKEELSYHVLSYLFAGTTLPKLRETFQDLAGTDFTRAIRHEMVTDPVVMQNTKFALYNSVPCIEGNYRSHTQTCLKLGLPKESVSLVGLTRESGLKRHLVKLAETYKPITLDKFQSEVARAWDENAKNVMGFARFKLRFLMHWGQRLDHLAADCAASAYESLLVQYPRIQSRVHLHNLYKQFVRQAGLKLIKHFTAQRNTVFGSDGNLLKLSLDYVDEEGEHVEDLDSRTDGFKFSCMSEAEANSNLWMGLSNANLTDQESKLIEYLMGETDYGFEKHVRQIIGSMSELRQKPRAYLEVCCDYLDIDSAQLYRLQTWISEGKMPSSTVNPYRSDFKPPVPERRPLDAKQMPRVPLGWC